MLEMTWNSDHLVPNPIQYFPARRPEFRSFHVAESHNSALLWSGLSHVPDVADSFG